jgi:hypothetical protein
MTTASSEIFVYDRLSHVGRKKLDAESQQPLKSNESLIVLEILSSATLYYYYYNNNSKTKRTPQTENIVY